MAWPGWPWPAVFYDRSTPMNVATFGLPLRVMYLAKMIHARRRILPCNPPSRGWNPFAPLFVSVSPTVTVTMHVVYRDGKELKPNKNETNQNQGFAKNWTERNQKAKVKMCKNPNRTETEPKCHRSYSVLSLNDPRTNQSTDNQHSWRLLSPVIELVIYS